MKIINTDECTHHIGDVHFYKDENKAGFSILTLEITSQDIKKMKATGKLYVIAGPGHAVPPPMQITTDNPFEPLPSPLKINR
jgi:hypothetical protein